MSYLESLFDLSGKVAVVIGGTGELCGHMAVGLAQAGCEVVVSGRNTLRGQEKLALIENEGGKAYFVEAEVTERGSLEALVDIVSERSGRIDIVINGAGVNIASPLEEVTIEELHKIFDINYTGTFLSCQVFGRYFRERSLPGSIINVGSVAGQTPISDSYSYSASKAAVHNLSKNLAREWAEYDIRVNTLVPGFFPATQHRESLDESRVLEILRKTPSSRFGNPRELIGATLLLASNGAGSFITGTELVVDGGFNAMTV